MTGLRREPLSKKRKSICVKQQKKTRKIFALLHYSGKFSQLAKNHAKPLAQSLRGASVAAATIRPEPRERRYRTKPSASARPGAAPDAGVVKIEEASQLGLGVHGEKFER